MTRRPSVHLIDPQTRRLVPLDRRWPSDADIWRALLVCSAGIVLVVIGAVIGWSL